MRQPWSPAMKRYHARFWPAILAYVVLLFAAVWLFKHHPPVGPLKYLLAVAPALPILAVIVILGRYLVEEQDEFRRSMVVQSMLWGLAFVLAVTTVWGFLETMAGAAHIPLYWVFPIYCAGMGIAQPFLYWRYR